MTLARHLNLTNARYMRQFVDYRIGESGQRFNIRYLASKRSSAKQSDKDLHQKQIFCTWQSQHWCRYVLMPSSWASSLEITRSRIAALVAGTILQHNFWVKHKQNYDCFTPPRWAIILVFWPPVRSLYSRDLHQSWLCQVSACAVSLIHCYI